MNRSEVVAAVAEDSGENQSTVSNILTSIINHVQHTVAEGGSVVLAGFGAFKAVDRAARNGRNPATGETIKIPAKKLVKFNVGKAFAEQANN